MNNPRDTTEYMLGRIDQNLLEVKDIMNRIEGELANHKARIRVLEAVKTRVLYMALGAGGVIAIVIQGLKSAWALVHH